MKREASYGALVPRGNPAAPGEAAASETPEMLIAVPDCRERARARWLPISGER
jgi:hypothetical protein